MPTYEGLLDEALARGLTVIEKYPFTSPRIRGLCCDDVIALSEKIDTEAERRVVLCEELTHAMHSAGDILDDPHMEQKARTRNFDRLVGIRGLIRAFLAGCRESWEFAEALNVPEAFLSELMANYRARYGTLTTVSTDQGVFALTFEPIFRVKRLVPTRCIPQQGKRKKEEAL
ncbi:MAG: hypothetical protein J6B09_00145 [Clostridia bacterium]|nr:hypothetical protein [Clostridia bacterium]